jgi:antitoxin MazE
MKTSIVRIGNSKGIRIPQAVLKQCGLEGEVELTVRDRSVVISPVSAPRAGWDEAFREMAERGDDTELLPNDLSAEADDADWQW